MENIDLDKEFKKVEQDIAIAVKQNKDIGDLLRYKIKLLKLGYKKFSQKLLESNQKMIAPLYAKKLSFLNNIKEIQTQLEEDLTSVNNEIKKVHDAMRQDGFGWILDNMPQRKA